MEMWIEILKELGSFGLLGAVLYFIGNMVIAEIKSMTTCVRELTIKANDCLVSVDVITKQYKEMHKDILKIKHSLIAAFEADKSTHTNATALKILQANGDADSE